MNYLTICHASPGETSVLEHVLWLILPSTLFSGLSMTILALPKRTLSVTAKKA